MHETTRYRARARALWRLAFATAGPRPASPGSRRSGKRKVASTTHGQATRCVDSMAHLGSPKCASQVPDTAVAPAASVRDRGDGRWRDLNVLDYLNERTLA